MGMSIEQLDVLVRGCLPVHYHEFADFAVHNQALTEVVEAHHQSLSLACSISMYYRKQCQMAPWTPQLTP